MLRDRSMRKLGSISIMTILFKNIPNKLRNTWKNYPIRSQSSINLNRGNPMISKRCSNKNTSSNSQSSKGFRKKGRNSLTNWTYYKENNPKITNSCHLMKKRMKGKNNRENWNYEKIMVKINLHIDSYIFV